MLFLNYKNLVCDYFFVYDKDSQKILNFIKTKFIVSGSVRNNEILRKKRKHKKYDVMFISEYRDKEKIKEFLKKKQSKLYRILATETLLFQSFILKALHNRNETVQHEAHPITTSISLLKRICKQHSIS